MRSQFHTSTHLQSQKSRRWPAAKTHVGFRRRRQELGDKATPAGATFMRVPPGSHAYTSAAELNAPLRGKLICCSQVPPATAPSANGDCSDFYAGGVAVYSGLLWSTPCRDLPVLLAQPRSLPVIVTYRFASSSRGHLLGAFCEHLVLAGFSTIERGICFFFFVVFRLCFYCTISGTICICSVNLV
jgi:hypothetical protein